MKTKPGKFLSFLLSFAMVAWMAVGIATPVYAADTADNASGGAAAVFASGTNEGAGGDGASTPADVTGTDEGDGGDGASTPADVTGTDEGAGGDGASTSVDVIGTDEEAGGNDAALPPEDAAPDDAIAPESGGAINALAGFDYEITHAGTTAEFNWSSTTITLSAGDVMTILSAISPSYETTINMNANTLLDGGGGTYNNLRVVVLSGVTATVKNLHWNYTGTYQGLYLNSSGSLNVQGACSLNGSGNNDVVIMAESTTITVPEGASFTVTETTNSPTIYSYYYVNFVVDGALNVNNTGTGNGVYVTGDINVSGKGVFSADSTNNTGIYTGGTLTVDRATVNATAHVTSSSVNGLYNGSARSVLTGGAAVNVTGPYPVHTGFTMTPGTSVTIHNTHATADQSIPFDMASPAPSGGAWELSGGATTTNPLTNPSIYATVKNGNTGTVTLTAPVCSITTGGTTTQYTSLDAALAAVPLNTTPGGVTPTTIKLLADITNENTTIEKKNIIFDLNGKNLVFKDNGSTALSVSANSNISFSDTAGGGKATVQAMAVDALEVLSGSTIVIPADITAAGDGNYAVLAESGSTITINGAVTATGAWAYGVYAEDENTSVKVNGDIKTTGDDSWGVDAEYGASVTVDGNIAAASGTGVYAADSGTAVTVTGGVSVGDSVTSDCWGIVVYDSATVNVTGIVTTGYGCDGIDAFYAGTSVTAGGLTIGDESGGIDAYFGAMVTVTGNITMGGNCDGIYAGGAGTSVTVDSIASGGGVTAADDGSTGVFAFDNASVTVKGDITLAGEYSRGVDANSGANVTIGSAAAPGNIGITGAGSYGVSVYDDSSTVIITGNITAGDSSFGVFTLGGVSSVTVNGNVTVGASGCGVQTTDGGQVTINGALTSGGTYIRVGGITKTAAQNDTTSSKTGYLQYSYTDTAAPPKTSTVWVKAAAPAAPVCSITTGGTTTLYTSLDAALAAVPLNTTPGSVTPTIIKLLTDITDTDGCQITDKNITFDLGSRYNLIFARSTAGGDALSLSGSKIDYTNKGTGTFQAIGRVGGCAGLAIDGGSCTLTYAETASGHYCAIDASSDAVVVVNGNVVANGDGSVGVSSDDPNVTVKVNGNITANGDVNSMGVYATGGAVTITGNIVSTGKGIFANGSSSNVSIKGNITTTAAGSYGVYAEFGAAVTVNGYISVASGSYANGSYGVCASNTDTDVTVTGNITAGDNSSGVTAYSGAAVKVGGAVSLGDSAGAGCWGIVAKGGSTVKVAGLVTAGYSCDGIDAYDAGTSVTAGGLTIGDSSDGISAGSGAVVELTGNITMGGDCDGISVGDAGTSVTVGGIVSGSGLTATSNGSTGVSANSSASVTVKGGITIAGTGSWGVDAGSGAKVTIGSAAAPGNITTIGDNSYGVYASDANTAIAVTGSITTGDDSHGVAVYSEAAVNVGGGVSVGDYVRSGCWGAVAEGGATVNVTGLVTAGYSCDGIDAFNTGTSVTVGGLTVGDDSWGVDAESGAAVTVTGNITLGASCNGIEAYNAGTSVTVGGIVSGSGLTATSNGSTGVSANSSASVTVKGGITIAGTGS